MTSTPEEFDNNKIPIKKLWQVITASSVGTVIEWYDFYIFGSLSSIISLSFFPKDDPTAAFISTLAAFGAGFVARPFGGILFGKLGDQMGRKFTFLLTLILMGGSTFAIAFIPSYTQIGLWAPAALLLLRILQGMALGGEYGGAATYVAEYSPDAQRGKYTSYIQTTATLGFFFSILVILSCQFSLGEEAFKEWGWRVPFGLSGILVVVSYFIRKNMHESPLFARLRKEGKLSENPLKEAFASKSNRRLMLIAMFGAIVGQGVVWHTGQFYAQIFINKILKVDFTTTNLVIAVSLVIGTPLFVYFGSLSDKIGRKKIMMTGMACAALFYYPLFYWMSEIVSNEGNQVGEVIYLSMSGKVQLAFICTLLVTFAALAYGPIAAFLVELFPTNIRYTSLSVPYHFANGVFGGCAPFVATYLGTVTHSNFAGIFYPISLAALTFVVGVIYLPETKGRALSEK
ncbi:MFS transporter [Sandaracinomonas limnophila]|uniref:MFS transporter n=1 Tax=Sandaracinomonas limnophila TaxID=1862386 RepID=A0A437PPK2_9BACT|nr:MFS transporter [Sandaracinomonas limnophila]RVU24246.1 MFS transporter [Sandaracinomonas limnophila]